VRRRTGGGGDSLGDTISVLGASPDLSNGGRRGEGRPIALPCVRMTVCTRHVKSIRTAASSRRVRGGGADSDRFNSIITESERDDRDRQRDRETDRDRERNIPIESDAKESGKVEWLNHTRGQ
jgi:hypothetical protein